MNPKRKPPRAVFSDAAAEDWRTGPDLEPCAGCSARRTACDGKRMLSGRTCCTQCAHPTRECGVS